MTALSPTLRRMRCPLPTRSGCAALLAALACLASCRGRGPVTAPAAVAHPNVLLVTIDTLRADRVGCYGYAGASTPVLDALSARGVRFATAVTHVPLTGPAHASILTGLTPLGHGFRENAGFVLPPQARSRRRGLPRRRATARPRSCRRFRWTAASASTAGSRATTTTCRRATTRGARLTSSASPTRRRTRPCAGSTAPGAGALLPLGALLRPARPVRAARGPGRRASATRRTTARSRSSTSSWAACWPRSSSGACSRGTVVARDGRPRRGARASTARARTACSCTTPRCASRSSSPAPASHAAASPLTVARGIDVLPTLLDLAGLAPRPAIEGRSLRPALEGREMSDAPAYAETIYPQREFGWAPLYAWRTATHKLIEAPRPELFELASDPGEATNRARTRPRARSRSCRRSCRRRSPARPTAAAAAQTDPEAAERLRALGYVAGGGGARAAAGSLRDPKDGQRADPGSQPRHVGGAHGPASGDPRADVRAARRIPGLLMARRSLAVAYTAARQYERAIAELPARREGRGAVGRGRGRARRQPALRGPARRGERRAREGRRARTRASPSPGCRSREVHIKRRDVAGAAAAYERVLQMAPDQVEALRGLGDLALVARRRGRRRDALRPHPRARAARRGRAGEARRAAHAGGRHRGGDRAVPPRDRARAEERRGAAVPRRRARLERAPRRGAALLREGARRPGSATRWR